MPRSQQTDPAFQKPGQDWEVQDWEAPAPTEGGVRYGVKTERTTGKALLVQE